MSALYQALPAVDKLLKTPQGEQFVAEFGHSATVNVSREMLQQAREHIKRHENLPHFSNNLLHMMYDQSFPLMGQHFRL